MLTVAELSKTYDAENIVGPVSLQVDSGTKRGLLGPNGSGKSTLLHSITGLIRFDQGHVLIDGESHDSLPARQVLGFVPDELPLPHSLTGRNYLDFILAAQPAGEKERAEMLKEAVGLCHADDRFIGEYSHGMKKKLQFIAGMLHRPRLLILDEPFRGLDPEARVLIEHLVDEHCRAGGAALIATHDLRWAEGGVDEVTILSEGSQCASGTVSELLTAHRSASLEEVFLTVASSRERYAAQLETIRNLF